MMKKLIFALIVSLFAVSAFAGAPALSDVDADHDGAVSQAEADAAGISADAFARADADADGKLTIKEYVDLATNTAK